MHLGRATTGQGGFRDVPFTISDLESADCPVSAITQRSKDLVRLFADARIIKEASGAVLFGPDASEWPGWAWDAARLLEVERIRIENARIEAETNAR